jgi:hypothetical protein
MGSSPGFASTAAHQRPIQTCFRLGSPPEAVNRAYDRKSPDHYSIGTRSRIPESEDSSIALPSLVGGMVSGSVTSPRRGSSHLSIALLSLLSVTRKYLALQDGPRRFEPSSTCSALLGSWIGESIPSHTRLSRSMVRLSCTLLFGTTLVTPWFCTDPVPRPRPD